MLPIPVSWTEPPTVTSSNNCFNTDNIESQLHFEQCLAIIEREVSSVLGDTVVDCPDSLIQGERNSAIPQGEDSVVHNYLVDEGDVADMLGNNNTADVPLKEPVTKTSIQDNNHEKNKGVSGIRQPQEIRQPPEIRPYTASLADNVQKFAYQQPIAPKKAGLQVSEGAVDVISEAMSMAKGYSKYTRFQELNLDTVLSALQYKTMMKSCFGHEQILLAKSMPGTNNVETQSSLHDITEALPDATRHRLMADIPNVTRCFEELYMREVIPGSQERQCAQGAQCECRFIDPMKPFIAVEFLTLEQLNQPAMQHPQMCVVCSRKQTQFLYYDMIFNRSIYNTVIQRYGNISGPGEYAAECLLKCTKDCDISCMPKPIMSHQRNRYTVHYNEDQNIHFLKQSRVSPDDFSPCPYGASADHVQNTCKTLTARVPDEGTCSYSTDQSSEKTLGNNTHTGIPRPGKGKGF